MVVEEQDIGLDSRVSRLERIAEQVNLRLGIDGSQSERADELY